MSIADTLVWSTPKFPVPAHMFDSDHCCVPSRGSIFLLYSQCRIHAHFSDTFFSLVLLILSNRSPWKSSIETGVYPPPPAGTNMLAMNLSQPDVCLGNASRFVKKLSGQGLNVQILVGRSKSRLCVWEVITNVIITACDWLPQSMEWEWDASDICSKTKRGDWLVY